MLVKIGDKIYDSEKEPIMIVLQDGDRDDMYRLEENEFRFCFFPKGTCYKKIEDFMTLEGDSNHGA